MGTFAGRLVDWSGTIDAAGLELADELSDLLARLKPEAHERQAFHAACFRAFRGEPVGELPLKFGQPKPAEVALQHVHVNELLVTAHRLVTRDKVLAKELWPLLRGVDTQEQALGVLTLCVAGAWRERRPREDDNADLRTALGTLLAHPASMSWDMFELEGPFEGRWDPTILWVSLSDYLLGTTAISVIDYDRSLGDQPGIMEPVVWVSLLMFATLSAWGMFPSAVDAPGHLSMPSTAAGASALSLYDEVLAFFEAGEWETFTVDGPDGFALGFAGKSGRWQCFCKVQEEHRRVLFYSVAPFVAPEHRRTVAAEFITQLNNGLVLGNFEMDGDDGEIRFQNGIDFYGAPFSRPMLRNLVKANLLAMDHHLALLSVAIAENI